MSHLSSSDNTGLQQATRHELELAAAENHRQLYSMNALALGGEVLQGEGISWTYAGPSYTGLIIFPTLTKETAGTALDKVMDYYRNNPPQEAGFFSLNPKQPPDIGVKLLARGWQPGWQPCWMAKDGKEIQPVEAEISGIAIVADNTTIIDTVKDLPYATDNAYMSINLFKHYPERAQRFLVLQHEKIIAQCCLFFSEGPYGIAGMYNVGVIPEERRRGIGKALVLAACRYAHEKGYRYVMLNANGDGRPVYEKAGFRVIGYGSTWWLMGKDYLIHPPSPDQIHFAEAIGTGDINALNKMADEQLLPDLHSPMINKMSWMQLAVQFRQTSSAEWLLANGAQCTALNAWDLGWKNKAAALLADNPEEVNRRYYEWGGTLAHVAAEQNDSTLLHLALSAKPDLTLQDLHHQGTPLDWALFFKRQDQVVLLKKYMEENQLE